MRSMKFLTQHKRCRKAVQIGKKHLCIKIYLYPHCKIRYLLRLILV